MPSRSTDVSSFLWEVLCRLVLRFLAQSGQLLKKNILMFLSFSSNFDVCRYYKEDGSELGEDEFTPLALYKVAEEAGSWDIVGNRVITLGTNM